MMNREASPESGHLETPRVSLAMPVFNEQELVPELVRRCLAVLDETPGGPHEMLVVDDGSKDETGALLERAAAEDARITVVRLSRNFGHQAAITAAIEHARGDVVLLMDGDLQDEPELLPRFLEQYHQGFDVVYGRRASRKESWWLRTCYHVFYRGIAMLSDLDLPLDSGDFALLTRRAVDAIVATPERNRYLRGLRTWVGFRQTSIDVARAARAAGETKYTIGRLVRLALDGIFSFSLVPLRLATLFGFLAIGLASAYALYAMAARIGFGITPRGFTALVVTVVFLAGVQLLFLGVVGEYIGRIYQEVKRRPHYIVDRLVRKSD